MEGLIQWALLIFPPSTSLLHYFCSPLPCASLSQYLSQNLVNMVAMMLPVLLSFQQAWKERKWKNDRTAALGRKCRKDCGSLLSQLHPPAPEDRPHIAGYEMGLDEVRSTISGESRCVLSQSFFMVTFRSWQHQHVQKTLHGPYKNHSNEKGSEL